ncbi:MAG: insulinase family protein [Bacteroidales bacterium]|nr:insulinase family protein [Bacteroidales bacterium]
MYQYHTLDNGIRIIFRQTNSIVTHAGVYIGVGSRHEQGTEEGIAHFIEHSIFKGTEHRRSYHIRNRIDGVGGELDAFTTKEETCVYASALSQHLDRCLELFADILFHSTFPAHEIEKEKDVVIEEINLYRDSPSELIFDDFEERYFGTHPLAHNILGNKKNVRHFTPEELKAFMSTHYTPGRMVISVVGNVEFKRLIHLCEKHFLQHPSSRSEEPQSPSPQPPQPIPQRFNLTAHKHTHQVHMLVGGPAPTLYDSDKTAFTLLNNIIGGPAMNSRLNVAVREREGFCYSIESQYVPFTDAGLFYIYAGVDSDAAERSTELILSELRNLRHQPLTPQHLHAAQTQLIGQMAITNDSGLNEMQSIGKACLNFEHADTLDEMNRDILALTPADLQQAAQRYLNPDNLSFLYYA